jgi:hypothetical protein
VDLVGECLLGWIDIVVDPIEQALSGRGDDAGLYIVDMRVDEAG